MTPFDKRGTFTATPAAVQEATAFDATTRAVDAVEHAEETDAQVETVEEAEALYAAALVTEAEADAGTWRGEWIGEQPTALTLFDVEQPAEQGALFTDAAPAEEATTPVRVRVRFDPATIERHVAKAAVDRAAFRAEMDARKAAEAARYGTPTRATRPPCRRGRHRRARGHQRGQHAQQRHPPGRHCRPRSFGRARRCPPHGTPRRERTDRRGADRTRLHDRTAREPASGRLLA
ncbi:hypothetical protein ACQEVM_38470 [Streptomyces sp. CA-243310]|uniref:hypothetical protein n=1 Tax=Streptomyces sp. CA-243310 TaxID=3240056 RepID=UPI003D8C346F